MLEPVEKVAYWDFGDLEVGLDGYESPPKCTDLNFRRLIKMHNELVQSHNELLQKVNKL